MDNKKVGINHIIHLYGVRFVLIKNEKGYKGYFSKKESSSSPVPLFQGYTFKKALGKLIFKAMHAGLISVEDHNNFVGMGWKTQIDIEVWSKMNKLVKINNQHFYKTGISDQSEE